MFKVDVALAGVAHWIERWPANQRVAGLIPSQGTCLDCLPGQVPNRQPHTDVSLPLFSCVEVDKKLLRTSHSLSTHSISM